MPAADLSVTIGVRGLAPDGRLVAAYPATHSQLRQQTDAAFLRTQTLSESALPHRAFRTPMRHAPGAAFRKQLWRRLS